MITIKAQVDESKEPFWAFYEAAYLSYEWSRKLTHNDVELKVGVEFCYRGFKGTAQCVSFPENEAKRLESYFKSFLEEME